MFLLYTSQTAYYPKFLQVPFRAWVFPLPLSVEVSSSVVEVTALSVANVDDELVVWGFSEDAGR